MDHPVYGSDLAPCDFFLFPTVKKELRGKRYPNAGWVVEVFQSDLSSLPKDTSAATFDDRFACMTNCIRVEGDYFEKQRKNFSVECTVFCSAKNFRSSHRIIHIKIHTIFRKYPWFQDYETKGMKSMAMKRGMLQMDEDENSWQMD